MTVNDIYTASVVLATGANEADEYEEVAVTLFNMCIGKCFDENNHIRQLNSKEKLKTVPFVKNLSDQMPYEDEFATALKYGLAAEILIADADMDEGKHSIYMQIFTSEVNKLAKKAVEESVVDVYAEY